MTLDDKVHGLRLQVIRRAEQLGNVSRACREAGISRALFYRWRQRLERYGQDGVHPRRHRARPGRPVQLAAETERLLLSVAVSAATWGASRIAAYLHHRWQLRVAPSTVQRALRRAGLATRRQRLTVLEHRALQTAGLLTERTRRALWQAPHGRPRHVAAREPGELVCLDTFYIGQLKGVGKVWQITACDAACSYGVAWLLPAHTAEAAAHFLRRVVRPLYRRAGWRLRRVLTDGGPEFKGAFDEACRALGFRHTDQAAARLDQRVRQTPPRHDPAGALARGLSPPLLHQSHGPAAQSRGVHAVLQSRAASPGLSPPGPHPSRALLGRRSSMTSCRTLGWSMCLHHSGSGQPSDASETRSPLLPSNLYFIIVFLSGFSNSGIDSALCQIQSAVEAPIFKNR